MTQAKCKPRPLHKHRAGGYEEAATVTDQLDAIWKIVRALVEHATPEQLAALPPEAMAVMRQISLVKERFPKKP